MRPSPDPLTHISAAMRPRLRCALVILLEAYESAADSKRNPWDFAVEIAELHAAGLRTTDLRWLVGKGYVQHAIEKTKGGDTGRVFGKWGQLGQLRFSDRSGFVLTEAGIRAARLLQGETVLSAAETPHWDDANHTLFWRSLALHHFQKDAPYQEAIVRRFEDEGWPRCVTVVLPQDPGVSSKERLHAAVQNLNRNVRPYLRFGLEGSGSRIYWEPAAVEP